MSRVPRVLWVQVLRRKRPVRSYLLYTDQADAQVRRLHQGFRVALQEHPEAAPWPGPVPAGVGFASAPPKARRPRRQNQEGTKAGPGEQ